MIYDTFRQALQNVWSNKFRTFLTMLGIIIGVMAVIIIVGLGNGMRNAISDEFSSIGTNLMTVNIMGRGARTASFDDINAMYEKYPEYFSAFSPNVTISGTVKVGTTTYTQTTVSGINESYFNMKSYTMQKGRALNYIDMADYKHVCVVGDYINRVAYGGNAVGQTIKVGANKFTIIGVMNARVEDTTQQEGSSDDYVYVPYTTAMRINKVSSASVYTFALSDESKAAEAKEALESDLYELFKSDEGYFVMSMSEMIDTLNSMVGMMTTVLTAIAGISLLVGGIGIMNIMTVSVTERTREIGIRKALGAQETVILLQFVVEAAVTSALGGILGIILGDIASAIINLFMPYLYTEMTLNVTPSISSTLIAFGISVGIGVLFGYLPARKAANLNPIDALRYD